MGDIVVNVSQNFGIFFSIFFLLLWYNFYTFSPIICPLCDSTQKPYDTTGSAQKNVSFENLLGLSSILAEMACPLRYRGWQATCRYPRVFKLKLTNFQAELNKQSGVLIVRVPFSLSERHGLPLSHKLQCCGGTVMSSRIVKMTHVACLAETQLPGLCLCQSLLMRKRLVGMLQNCWVYNKWHGLFLFSSAVHNLNLC